MRRPPNTLALVVVALTVLLTVPACSSAHPNFVSAPTSTSPTSTPSSSPSGTPTSPKPRPVPTVTPTTPKPVVTPVVGAIHCTGPHVALNRSTAGGIGPLGSMRSTGTTAVALTFDDGPDPVNTPKILDLLKECGVHATFCLVGHRARDNPDLVRRIVAEGNTLCNHSWQHLDLAHPPATTATGKPYTILHDLEATNNAIRKAVPGAVIKYFRAPYGSWTPAVIAAAKQLGMTPLDWGVDPRDWDSATFGTGLPLQRHIISAVESDVHPGSIVLSHDNVHPDTIVAYRTLLPWLKARFTLIALPTGESP